MICRRCKAHVLSPRYHKEMATIYYVCSTCEVFYTDYVNLPHPSLLAINRKLRSQEETESHNEEYISQEA